LEISQWAEREKPEENTIDKTSYLIKFIGDAYSGAPNLQITYGIILNIHFWSVSL